MKGNLRKILILISLVLFSVISLLGCSKTDKAKEGFEAYKEAMVNQNFEAMYEKLSTESKGYITKEDFVSRYSNIYSAIEAENIVIEINGEIEKTDNGMILPFTVKMDTVAGVLELNNFNVTLVQEEKEYKVLWNESLIFPDMVKDDKVRVNIEEAKRGSILDREGKPLAEDGVIKVVGIYPEIFDKENKEAKIKNISEILDIDENVIVEKLNANTNPEHFVNIVDIMASDEKLSKLINRDAEGILVKEKSSRVYIGGEAFGRLIGYIGPITAEELEENKDKGYVHTDYIGKAGLEQVYEDTLRGRNGGEILIERGEENKSIAKSEVQNGKDIKLSIDSGLQSKIYSEFGEDRGASTAVDPKTGEVLAMVSAPSYDSNVFITYATNAQKKKWQETNNADEINRFNKVYSPGSTMKLLTAAIGLENKVYNPDELRNIEGSAWQKDSTWGDFKITRVTDPGRAINLNDAVNYSDNIYFGQIALEVGSEKMIEGIKKFGIGEELTFEYPIEASHISNDGTINRDILLADSGYGQGELMVTPLNMALAYSALGNEGNIMQPRLVVSENTEAKVWRQNTISKENLNTLITAFSGLISNGDGTASLGKIDGVNVAGKTGTAEIKKSQDDETGTENGWFVAVNTDDSKIAISMIIEDVKGRGGSQIPIPKVKNSMEYYLKR